MTESGKTELKELGQRYKARLSDLLDEPYNEENIIVQLNEYETAPYFIQLSQNLTYVDCLLITMYLPVFTVFCMM